MMDPTKVLSFLQNGSITHREHLFTRHYCYTPLLANATPSWSWQPLACSPEKLHFVLGVREWTYAICEFHNSNA